jgi:hypothetical protein
MRTMCLALVVLAACSKADPKPEPKPTAGSAAVASPAGLAIFVDDKQVATVAPAQLATWPRLDTLVPVSARRLGTWENIALAGGKPAPVDVHAPSSTYPELVPAVFPGADGTPSFGMFDPVELAKHGNPSLREDGLHEVRIKLAQDSGRGQHEQGAGGGTDPADLKLSIKTPKGEHVIDGKTLLAIPREKMPGGEGQGWSLITVLKAAGVTQFQELILNDAAGLALNLDKAAFDPATSIPFIKLNRSGQLRFRVYKKQGDSWTASGDLRGLTAIGIVK